MTTYMVWNKFDGGPLDGLQFETTSPLAYVWAYPIVQEGHVTAARLAMSPISGFIKYTFLNTDHDTSIRIYKFQRYE